MKIPKEAANPALMIGGFMLMAAGGILFWFSGNITGFTASFPTGIAGIFIIVRCLLRQAKGDGKANWMFIAALILGIFLALSVHPLWCQYIDAIDSGGAFCNPVNFWELILGK